MKITVRQLRQIIKEEIKRKINEDVSTMQAKATLDDFAELIKSVVAMHPEKQNELMKLQKTVFSTIERAAGFGDVHSMGHDTEKKLDKSNLPPDPRKKGQKQSTDRKPLASRPNLESRLREFDSPDAYARQLANKAREEEVCVCIDDDGHPDPTCPGCDGVGFVRNLDDEEPSHYKSTFRPNKR